DPLRGRTFLRLGTAGAGAEMARATGIRIARRRGAHGWDLDVTAARCGAAAVVDGAGGEAASGAPASARSGTALGGRICIEFKLPRWRKRALSSSMRAGRVR